MLAQILIIISQVTFLTLLVFLNICSDLLFYRQARGGGGTRQQGATSEANAEPHTLSSTHPHKTSPSSQLSNRIGNVHNSLTFLCSFLMHHKVVKNHL